MYAKSHAHVHYTPISINVETQYGEIWVVEYTT